MIPGGQGCVDGHDTPLEMARTAKFYCLISLCQLYLQRIFNQLELLIHLSCRLLHSLAAKGQFTHSQLHLYQPQPPLSPSIPPSLST